jgi:DNA-binding HxlR family transcriptional regulator
MAQRERDPAADIQDILKCKWALLILGEISAGRARPSAIERAIPGLSHKILHERLNKLSGLAVVERVEMAAKSQAVAYRLTGYGRELGAILEDIRRLRERCRSA